MDSKTQEGKSYKMKYTEMLQLTFVSTFFKMSPIIHSRLKLYLTMKKVISQCSHYKEHISVYYD